MKNINLFSVLVIIFFTLFANKSAHCHELSKSAFQEKERGYGFSAGPQFGVLYGHILELVYPVDTMGELLSELKWDMKPVFYSGIALDFGLKDISSSVGFFSTLSFKAGIGGDSGKMEDRDWMSRENAELTHFSSHTNKTTEFFWVEITAGASIPVKSYLYIKPLFGFSWIRFSFTARDGYTEYARRKGFGTYYPIDDIPDILYYSEDVCTYLQDWLMVTTGFIIGTKILYPFSFDLSFKISPLTFTDSRDDHILRKETFLDYTRFGLFVEPAVSFSFTTQRLDFSFDLTYHFNGRTKGETYSKKWNSEYYSKVNNKAGAGLSLFDARTLIKIRI